MLVRDRRFGQIEAAEAAAETPAPVSAVTFYFVAVAAGVTVYLVTKMLNRRKS